MNVKTVKQTEPRVEYPNISNLGIHAYGYNNLYPQDIRAIVACSESASSCLNRYIQFIQGNGFKDVAFAETILNWEGETADDLLQLTADDLGNFNGFAFHINYDLLGNIVEIHHIPFENCRLCEEDENGSINKIAVFADWTGKKKRNGRSLKPTRETIDYIEVFNPDKLIVLSQIEAAGGIEQYKGQILWVSGAGRQEYPKAIYDSVVTQMSTEEGLGNIAYRNTRNNFTPAGMLVTKKGQDTGTVDDELAELLAGNSIAQSVAQIQGDLNTNKILHFEVEYDEEKPEFVNFQGANYDKDFSVTSNSTCEKIYAAFGQEAWHRIRKGSLGFSTDVLLTAYESYSSVTGTQRRMIERAFDKIFKYWHEAVSTSDFTVEPLKYISSESSDNN